MQAESAREPSARTAFRLCALAVGVGAALRLPGLWSDLWLDEIWTWRISQRLTSALDVFTAIHHSANHYGHMLWFYAVGDAPAWLLRLPSYAGGVACIALAARLAWRRGRLEAVFAAWLFALSFGLVFFSSEGRGYAAMLACVLAAQLALEAALERPRAAAVLGFGAALMAAVVFHLVALFYWAGAAAQSLWAWRRAPWPVLARRLAALHALPAAAFAVLYAVDLRLLVAGAGDPPVARRVAAEVLAAGFGVPLAPQLAWVLALPALALVGAGLALRARAGDPFWICAAVASFVAPPVVLIALKPEMIAIRYFLIGITFALLLCADLAAAAWRAGGWRRALAWVLLAGFAAGNAEQLLRFAQLGRGGYRAAVQAMAAQSHGAPVTVAGDHDFRTGQVVAYYARELAPATPVVYLPQERWPAGGTDWLIRQAPWQPRRIAPRIVVRGTAYRLVAEYPFAGFAGLYWALYRREPPPDASMRGRRTFFSTISPSTMPSLFFASSSSSSTLGSVASSLRRRSLTSGG